MIIIKYKQNNGMTRASELMFSGALAPQQTDEEGISDMTFP